MNDISIEKLQNEIKNSSPLIIDIRSNYSYQQGSIPGAKNIPVNTLINSPSSYLDKNKTYYIYCQSGHTSKNVVMRLNSQGYNTVNILGGFNNYLLRK